MEKHARYFQPLMHMTLVPSPYRAPGNEASMGLPTLVPSPYRAPGNEASMGLDTRLAISIAEETNRQTAKGSLAGTFSTMAIYKCGGEVIDCR